MTVHAEPPHTTAPAPWPPGTYVYDTAAQAAGRIADPTAYPPRYIDAGTALIVPLSGSGPSWPAETSRLRLATRAEIDEAHR